MSIYDLSKMSLSLWQFEYDHHGNRRWWSKWTVPPIEALTYDLRESKTFGPFKAKASAEKIAHWWRAQKEMEQPS